MNKKIVQMNIKIVQMDKKNSSNEQKNSLNGQKNSSNENCWNWMSALAAALGQEIVLTFK